MAFESIQFKYTPPPTVSAAIPAAQAAVPVSLATGGGLANSGNATASASAAGKLIARLADLLDTNQYLQQVILAMSTGLGIEFDPSVDPETARALQTIYSNLPVPTSLTVSMYSHVGQVLGLSTSHPPEVDADSGGFEVLRDPGAAAAAMDPGFGILMANVLQSGLLHNGDVYGLLSQGITAYPGAVDGDGAMTTTSLGLMSAIASILVGHVNKVSHKNPHGITLPDLGLTISYDFVANNGYIKFAMGTNVFMIQWGTMASVGNSAPGSSFSFNPAFPNNCFGVYGVAVCLPGFDSGFFVLSDTPSTYGFTAYVGGPPSARTVYWIAVGN